MYKVANQVLDIYDDMDKSILKKVAATAPKFLKVATPLEVMKLKDHQFALTMLTKSAGKINKFPVHDLDNTFVSNAYFEETHTRLPETAIGVAAYHIKQACEAYGVRPGRAVVRLAKKASSNVYVEEERPNVSRETIYRSPAGLSEFAEVEKIATNYTFAQFAFKDPTHVKVACEYFERFHEKFPTDLRFKYAGAIQRRADELGMPPCGGSVAKYAKDGYSGQVTAHVLARKSLYDGVLPKYVEALDKLAAMQPTIPAGEFADHLAALDKKAGATKYYGSALVDPYLVTFKMGEPPRMVKAASGSSLPEEQLRSLVVAKRKDIEDYFGKDVADELVKHPTEIFESLPNDAKEVIVGMANGSY